MVEVVVVLEVVVEVLMVEVEEVVMVCVRPD